MRRAGRKLAVATGVLVGLPLLLEGGARAWLALRAADQESGPSAAGVETDWLGMLSDDLGAAPDGPELYRPDPELFWTLRQGARARLENRVYDTHGEPVTWSVTINDEGFRGPPYPEEPTRADPVVVALGDSCTFGFRVDDGDTWPARLEERLRARGHATARVVNYGVPGYSSFQGRRLLERVLVRHDPDVVVLSFGANDHDADRFSDAEKARRSGSVSARLARFAARLAVTRLLRGPRGDRRTAPGEFSARTARVTPEEYRANLRAMVARARAADARVVLLDMSFVARSYGRLLPELAEEQRVPLVRGPALLLDVAERMVREDLYPAERRQLDRFWKEEVRLYRTVYFPRAYYEELTSDPRWARMLRYLMVEPVHPNALGQRIVARAVSDAVAR